jgi:xanthine dehydrogenase accessory factor
MTDLDIFAEALRLGKAGEPFSLAVVTESSGSSPRKAGARMLVRGDGTVMGSVGGGTVELETVKAAQTALAEGAPRTLSFVLTEEHGFACGGSMTVFVEPHGSLPRLIMFGAGHVGRAVAALAWGCGFRVTVVDERPECASREQLPGADEVLCCGVRESFARLRVDADTRIVIATPGHQHDFDAVRGALATEAGFVGLLGSRRKRQTLLELLEKEGVDEAGRSRVVTPVGLDIGAQTPEELAVSIVGQLIQLRRKE